MEKHEWRKKEKGIYLPGSRPEVVDIPAFRFICIEGEGNPNSSFFAECISVLYSLSYAVKMTSKKREIKPPGYFDYTVYPLEGVWDLNIKGRQAYNGTINKDDLVYNLMIRQPDFVDEAFFEQILDEVRRKKPHELLDKVWFEEEREGRCVQMLHSGSFDNEPESFRIMEEFTENQSLRRALKVHREIYLSDFRKTATERLKTVLRFKVEPRTL